VWGVCYRSLGRVTAGHILSRTHSIEKTCLLVSLIGLSAVSPRRTPPGNGKGVKNQVRIAGERLKRRALTLNPQP
jgi:hypothetical protein